MVIILLQGGLPSIGKGDESLRNKNKVNNEMNKFVKNFVKQNPTFVNKYANRSNGGIPCFSEERLLERAAKVCFVQNTVD